MTSPTDDEVKPTWRFWLCVGLIALAIVGLWFAWWGIANKVEPRPPERGQMGDLFGGINALFSGLALAGVVTAVILQSQELQEQRKILKTTNEEMRKTSAANKAAADALSKQIDMQLMAAELSTVSTLLASVNAQIIAANIDAQDINPLRRAREAYHKRLHEVLKGMNRAIEFGDPRYS